MTDRIDLLYKNLEHVSEAYFAVEGVFPIWESVFALIIGQLFIAYFTSDGDATYQKIGLALLGVVLSYIWFILVSLNFQNSLHIGDRVADLQNLLADELKEENHSPRFHEFIRPWPSDKQKENWTGWNIITGKRESEDFGDAVFKARKSTWLYRRVLPLILLIAWCVLLYKISPELAALIIVFIPIITIFLFDP